MKALPWIIAGVGVGFATYFLLNQPSPQYATGSDDVEDAANRAWRWGTKQRATGTGTRLVGKLKEGVGRATGNDTLAGEGVVDQVAGAAKDAAGKVAHAVSETVHDLNR
ncbi:MAG: hypothetical protein JWM43_1534 [Acidobacteriaceae bacterium]|nr:hypothetical protein [Acidobacteriaceae bacterium]